MCPLHLSTHHVLATRDALAPRPEHFWADPHGKAVENALDFTCGNMYECVNIVNMWEIRNEELISIDDSLINVESIWVNYNDLTSRSHHR